MHKHQKLANALMGYAGAPKGVTAPGAAVPGAPGPQKGTAPLPAPPPPAAAAAPAPPPPAPSPKGGAPAPPAVLSKAAKAEKLKSFLDEKKDFPSSKPVEPPPPPKAFKPKKPRSFRSFRSGATSGTL